VLAPTWKEEAGVHALNKLLQPLVNPPSPSSTTPAAASASPFQLHDRVMQMRNNVDKDVYNGDMGIVTSITPGKAVQVTFARPGKADEDDQDHVVTYEGLEVKQQLQLAWATTVHKASKQRAGSR
jgi:exodeoxyribonuclease V alpha subunit